MLLNLSYIPIQKEIHSFGRTSITPKIIQSTKIRSLRFPLFRTRNICTLQTALFVLCILYCCAYIRVSSEKIIKTIKWLNQHRGTLYVWTGRFVEWLTSSRKKLCFIIFSSRPTDTERIFALRTCLVQHLFSVIGLFMLIEQ